jgi:D-alanine transaminase
MIPATDRGFLFGDAVYEVIRVYHGRPFLLDDHIQRLGQSLEAIRIAGIDLDRLRRRVLETITAAGVSEALAYIQVTRGSGPLRSHSFPPQAIPLEFLYVQSFADPFIDLRSSGGSVLTLPDNRWERRDVKSTNLLANVLAAQAAKEAGCVEAVYVEADGTLSEGARTSLFGVLDGQLLTAPNSPAILPGITRKLILELARKADVPVREQVLRHGDLPRVAELFLTGTTLEVLPIVRVDGQLVQDGRPGPLTRRLQQAYRQVVRDCCGG